MPDQTESPAMSLVDFPEALRAIAAEVLRPQSEAGYRIIAETLLVLAEDPAFAPAAAPTAEGPREGLCTATETDGAGRVHQCGYRIGAHNRYQHRSAAGFLWPIDDPTVALPGAQAGRMDEWKMLLVWEAWAKQEGNDGAAKLFRGAHTRIANLDKYAGRIIQQRNNAEEELQRLYKVNAENARLYHEAEDRCAALTSEVARLTERCAVLSDFARTAPGRLPQHVTDALSPWRAAVPSTPNPEASRG